MPETILQLCAADEKTFWPWRKWTEFARLADKQNIAVIVPLAGFSDWGLGHALDAEETVLMPVLAAASARLDSTRLLVVPPLRFIAGHAPGSAFAVDVPSAHAFIDEACASIAAAGFRRIVLLNASPWNEELIDVAARDLRITRGLQMFCINLGALELDFHPTRSRSRREVQTLLTALTGTEPEIPPRNEAPPSTSDLFALDPEHVTPLPGPALDRPTASAEGAEILARAATHLAALLNEILARPPLPRDGALRNFAAS